MVRRGLRTEGRVLGKLPQEGYDVAIGSRGPVGAREVGKGFVRRLMSGCLRWIVATGFRIGVQDTQCGFKSFSREAAHLVFPLQTIDGWGFDVEILYIAQRHGLQIEEVPVNWYYGSDSRVRPVQDTINMVRELLLIRANGRKGLYDSLPTQTVGNELPV